MALVPCPDCGREVSEAAPTCPGCGRPMTSGPTKPTVARVEASSRVALLRVAGLVGCLVGLVASCGGMVKGSDTSMALGGITLAAGLGAWIASKVLS